MQSVHFDNNRLLFQIELVHLGFDVNGSTNKNFLGMFGPLGLFQQNPWIDPGYLHHLEYLFR